MPEEYTVERMEKTPLIVMQIQPYRGYTIFFPQMLLFVGLMASSQKHHSCTNGSTPPG